MEPPPSTFSILRDDPEPTHKTYEQLIAFCCAAASTMLLVVRDPHIEQGEAIGKALSSLAPFFVSRCLARESPGTVLFSDDAAVYRYSVHGGLGDVMDVMVKEVVSLFGWLHPAAPEDLCFLRSNGTSLLVTISHERDAYMLLSEGEVGELRGRFPELASIVAKEAT